MSNPAEGITAAELLGRVASDEYRIVKTVLILIAPHALTDEHADLEAAFTAAAENDMALGDNRSPVIAARLQEIESELAGYYVEFKVGALARKVWADLLAAHPPTKAQLQADKRIEFNPETFPAAAIAACLIVPAMTLDEVKVLENGADGVGGLTDAQFNVLFNAVAGVNVSGLSAPKSVAASVLRRVNAESSLPLTTTGSLDQSFSDA